MEMYFLKHPIKGLVKSNGTFGSDDRLYKTPKKVEWAAKIHYAQTYRYATCRIPFRDLMDIEVIDNNFNTVNTYSKPSIDTLRQIAFVYGYFDNLSYMSYSVYCIALEKLGNVTDEYLYSSNTDVNIDKDDFYRSNGFVFFKNDEDALMTSLSNPHANLLKMSNILDQIDNYILKELEGV